MAWRRNGVVPTHHGVAQDIATQRMVRRKSCGWQSFLRIMCRDEQVTNLQRKMLHQRSHVTF
eukprot:11203378-Lingulodinium_polyedra.AAC.1